MLNDDDFALKFRPIDKVKCCFNKVERCIEVVSKTATMSKQQATKKVASCFDNFASTLLLVWTGL